MDFNICLISLNYSPELTGIGKYNGEMCADLATQGHSISVVTAPPYYPEWKVHKDFTSKLFREEQVNGVNIQRCPIYVPAEPTTLKRILHLASFAASSVIGLVKSKMSKPDVVMLVQPTLFCAPFTLLYAKCVGAKTIMHVQDYEVDALFGLGMMKGGLLQKFVCGCESWLMKRFDAVSTISYSMIENAKAKGVDAGKIIYFPNWSDTSFVTPNTDGSVLKRQWGFGKNDKVVLYSGNIGKKQGLEVVVEAAKKFQDDESVKFVLVGSGSYVEELKAISKAAGVDNVYFKPLQPWERVPQMLALADVHLVVQKKGAADAVLPSKLTNILSAGGHALVTAEAHTELGKIELEHPKIYHRVEPENTGAFIDGLSELLARDTQSYNNIARAYAEANLDKQAILKRFCSDLESIV
ncbi:glycosyltransferase WbuB [Vibrio sp. 1CM2L]|uniref:glycosyltransferase WbuB n=1 Tax=Vibrio sp. 1CM2L TaxID=2929166 RepID=UPI0020BFDF94|nr:glycosyltransferase WbuB [Vibrio sp. 1CM2L]MCK8077192.1 glycosyltransferase WbuB [Vibrio sp. 1CM2L]